MQQQLSKRKLFLLLLMGREWRERDWLWHHHRDTLTPDDFYEDRSLFDGAVRRLVTLGCFTEREDGALRITQYGEDLLVVNPTFLVIMRRMSAILAVRGGINP